MFLRHLINREYTIDYFLLAADVPCPFYNVFFLLQIFSSNSQSIVLQAVQIRQSAACGVSFQNVSRFYIIDAVIRDTKLCGISIGRGSELGVLVDTVTSGTQGASIEIISKVSELPCHDIVVTRPSMHEQFVRLPSHRFPPYPADPYGVFYVRVGEVSLSLVESISPSRKYMRLSQRGRPSLWVPI